jgi:hypothetical protein
MSTFRPRWFLCGGWAVDAWLGRQTRGHGDLDIAVFREDEHDVFDHLAGWQLIGHDTPDAEHTDPWDGRPLGVPAHIHARAPDGFNLEVLVEERSGRDWVLHRDPRITLPMGRSTLHPSWDLPTASSEALLFYKATASFDPARESHGLRSLDEVDFRGLFAVLDATRRTWLWEAISLLHPSHPWLP